MENIEVKVLEFLKGIGTIVLYFVISNVMAYFFSDYMYHDNALIATVSQIAFYLVLLLILGLIYHRRLIHDFKNFKKEYIKVAIKNWIIGLGIMYIANILISSFGSTVSVNEEANRTLISLYPISSVIDMVILAPLIEELTFRAGFKKAFSKWYTFAFVTALLFGLAHVQVVFVTKDWMELLYLIPYSTLGFFFAKAFYETDNIFTSYFAHFLHNLVCVVILILLFLIW